MVILGCPHVKKTGFFFLIWYFVCGTTAETAREFLTCLRLSSRTDFQSSHTSTVKSVMAEWNDCSRDGDNDCSSVLECYSKCPAWVALCNLGNTFKCQPIMSLLCMNQGHLTTTVQLRVRPPLWVPCPCPWSVYSSCSPFQSRRGGSCVLNIVSIWGKQEVDWGSSSSQSYKKL